MMAQEVNVPQTSSCGRLFDAVSALVGLREVVNYEAQAAIELEMAIADSDSEVSYPIDLNLRDGIWLVDTKRLFQAIVSDLENETPVAAISQRFHNGLVLAFHELAQLLRQASGLNRVCLSGGTFHNVYLLTRLQHRLEEDGFEVFTHREVPAGDGGLSLGQAMIAAHRVRSS